MNKFSITVKVYNANYVCLSFFGIEDQQGTIDKGMMADLVLLDANPLEDIKNTRRIWAVMKEGHLHTREVLDNILDQLENPR